MGALFSALLLKDAAVLLGPPPPSEVLLPVNGCSRRHGRSLYTSRWTAATKERGAAGTAATRTHPCRKTRNNNCFYSTHEGQINTFLSWQIKMNNAGRASAIYSARYMGNGMQFGRVVTWNGTNELLSAPVTFCGRWRDVRPLLICGVIPQQSSEQETLCVVFGSTAAGPSFSSTFKTKNPKLKFAPDIPGGLQFQIL